MAEAVKEIVRIFAGYHSTSNTFSLHVDTGIGSYTMRGFRTIEDVKRTIEMRKSGEIEFTFVEGNMLLEFVLPKK